MHTLADRLYLDLINNDTVQNLTPQQMAQLVATWALDKHPWDIEVLTSEIRRTVQA